MTYIEIAKLNVKQKSLAAESRILKDEINKTMKSMKYAGELQNHMIHVVNPELRATGLAVAFATGKAYKDLEATRKPEKEYHFRNYTLKKMVRILKKYHKEDISILDVDKWLNA